MHRRWDINQGCRVGCIVCLTSSLINDRLLIVGHLNQVHVSIVLFYSSFVETKQYTDLKITTFFLGATRKVIE